jgi:UDP-glucose 4-epimerase
MRCLVTGGAGFIGSHIAEDLVERGHEVVIVDDLSSGKEENLAEFIEKVEFIHADIRNTEVMQGACAGVEVVFHEAAVASVSKSVEDPVGTEDVNIGGTVSVLTAAKDAGVHKVIFASSAAVYGDDPELPKSEEMAPKPTSPYAFHKLAGESYLTLFHKLHGLKSLSFRYFNVFGPRQDPSSPYSGVISIFVDRFKKDMPYVIHGDGRQSRDFIYVKDVVRANLAAVAEDFDHVPVVNVGCNRSHDLLELVRLLQKISGSNRQPEFAGARSGDIRHSVADNTKLKTLLGIEPATSFEEGLQQLWQATG